jgi:hypothetical protein
MGDIVMGQCKRLWVCFHDKDYIRYLVLLHTTHELFVTQNARQSLLRCAPEFASFVAGLKYMAKSYLKCLHDRLLHDWSAHTR